jgi:tetratricopeptide (TPR) repeat protein
MIEVLKKRYKVGDLITIHTGESSFTGKIEEFEDTCIILETENSVEFITYTAIVRLTAQIIFDKTDTKVENNNTAIESVPNNALPKIDNETIYEDNNDVSKPKIGIKIIGKMPLDVLEKATDEKTKTKKAKAKPQLIFKSFGELEKLISTEIENENKKTVSANGVITKCFGDKSFGFITDKFGYEIWFGFRNVVDDNLLSLLRGNTVKINIPVLFTLSKNNKGNSAILIQKSNTIESILEKIKYYLSRENFDLAIGLLEQILYVYPENRSALKIQKELKSKSFKKKGFVPKSKFRTYDINYQKATKAKNINKDFDTALKYYLIAFENNEKRESCIKDIAMLYVSMGETQKAIDFMLKYEKELSYNVTTYNYLANFYSSVKEYDKVIENIDLLLEERFITNDKRKLSMYLSQKGFALIQQNNLEDALDILEEAISAYSDNTYANRLLKAIEDKDEEELSIAIAEAEFDSFGGGISKYLKDLLDNYDEYFGVPPKVIDSGDFKNETLATLRKLIDRAGRARPRERANYLLTEAKLMSQLEPDKERNLRSVLARYCNAMALNHIAENSHMDVIRNYYLEAFSLEEKYRLTAPQVALYLISYKSSYSELISTKTPSMDEALKFILDNESKDVIWEGLLSMFLWNRSISAQLISKIYDNSNFRNLSLNYLSKQSVEVSKNISVDEYIGIWNLVREKRQRDYSKWLASVKSIYSVSTFDVIVNQLSDSLQDLKRNWLTQLDATRLNIISSDIYEVLNQYLMQSGYRDKERYYNFAKSQVNQIISEIKEKPTKFSYEAFIPLLEKLDFLLEKSFNIVESASTPVIKVSILGEASIVSLEKTVPIRLLIENSKNSSPIRDISIEIANNENIISCNKGEYFDSIDGGENAEIHLKATVSEKVLIDKATSIDVVCNFKKRNQEELTIIKEQLTLRLYSEEEFEPIPNPFEKLANGGPVTDTSMFYGRNEFIERITDAIIKSDSKQVVIYGQKRSGKSSVLYHLKKSLESTDKTFCITFSIGDIFETLTSATFFYKILSLIDEELENMSFDGKEVPEFKIPPYSEFKDQPNPADSFRKEIKKFKRDCSLIESWKDKKLVVMIDEFTYLYTAIKEQKVSDAIMKQWKAITQNEDSTFSSVLVGQDVFPMFKDEFPNEFGVTQDERLTYLSKDDAIRLIEEPIGKTKTNRNRFITDAIDTIIDYTSCNPYYIQIFCARLVNEMNRKKYIEVTSADIKEIADSFIYGGQALTDDKFDNLLNAGEKHDIQKIPQEHSKAILRKIATNAMNIGFCLREQISIGQPEYEDEILYDLVKREVLEQKNDSYKIQVKLFQEWLLKH